MTTWVDLDALSSEDLDHLRSPARELERERLERVYAKAAELMERPTLGFYRRRRQESPS